MEGSCVWTCKDGFWTAGLVESTVGVKVNVTVSSSQPKCCTGKENKENLLLLIIQDVPFYASSAKARPLVAQRAHLLTVHVCVQHVHKHGV